MAKKSSACEKYRCEHKVTLDWKNFNKWVNDHKTVAYGMGVEDLPKYFVNKSKKNGRVSIWFEFPGEGDTTETLTAYFPAYTDNGRLLVVLDPVRITGGADDWSREFGSQWLMNMIMGLK